MTDLGAITWPLARLGEALDELARRAGLAPAPTDALVMPPAVEGGDDAELERWVDWACARLTLEAEPVDASVPEIARFLRDAAPAVLRLPLPGGTRVAMLLGRRGDSLRLVGPDGRVHACPSELLRRALCAPHEEPLHGEIAGLLDAAGVPAARRDAVRAVLLAERLATQRVAGCWILRHGAGTGFLRQLAHARVPQRIGWMLGLFALVYLFEILAWKLIGEAALDGRLDRGWLTGWVLLMASMIPLQLASGWFDATFSLDAGRLLKQRLMGGALRMDLDEARRLGAGQLLGRVMESQALEALALNGGLAVLVSLVELAFATWVLSAGASPTLQVALVPVWLALIAVLVWRFVGALRRWTAQRLAMTNDLVERMVGHRTRLAQERPERRDAADDRTMQAYLTTSAEMDGKMAAIVSAVPSGWVIASLAALAPAFASGRATPGALAVSLGGMLFAHRALNGISGALNSLARAALAWDQVGGLFGSAAQGPASEPFVASATVDAGRGTLAEASALGFRHAQGTEPVLRGLDLRIAHGERILLEGASGGGKSTLAALLTGLRRPDSGLLLLAGLDRHTLGANWHRVVTEAPQFHDNHVLTGTLGFNLLMGRNWPASPAELAEAKTLCEELGLGALIARMPAGLNQRIGETGWQLSHGERSRLFLARALLQRAPLTILDESFAALDPATLAQCLATALRRSKALLVIAHP